MTYVNVRFKDETFSNKGVDLITHNVGLKLIDTILTESMIFRNCVIGGVYEMYYGLNVDGYC